MDLEEHRMDDLISRQAAIDAIEHAKTARSQDGEIYVAKLNAEMNIQILPSAERKKGRWIHERLASTTGGSYPIVRCSVCSGTMPFEWETRFCPHCGAEMRGEEE